MSSISEYLVAGGAWFWSGYFIIVFLTPIIGLWWANLIGNAVGLTLNFILERYWVFEGGKKRKVTEVSSRYIILTAVNFFLNYFILKGLLSVGINVAIGQFVSAGFFTIWNYFWYRFWVFKEPPHKRRIRHHV
ncbi:MAG: GtrA family protein [Candidatus Saccharimonadales bacterium]